MMDDNDQFKCSLCCFISNSYEKFTSHVVRLHRHDANFVCFCSFGNCSYSSRSWGAFKAHMSRKHSIQNVNNAADGDMANYADVPEQDDDNDAEVSQMSELQMTRNCNASFSLALECSHNLTHSSVDRVIESVSSLIEQHVSLFKTKIREKLQEQCIPCGFMTEISVKHLLDEICTRKKRDKLYEQIYFYVPPKAVKLGEKFVTVKGVLQKKDIVGYCIPFTESLTNLVLMPDVWKYISNPRDPSHYMYDISDGECIRSDPLFTRNPQALQVILNTDDIEIVNPIGSHTKKHKLTMFYYTLANIPPEYRSQLQTIQLLGVARSKDIRKYGSGALLEDFVSCINKLSSGGLELKVNGVNMHLEGKLVIVPCDTPAAQWLGGFKEGVSFALHGCRCCQASQSDMKRKFVEQEFVMREEGEHRRRCLSLDGLSKAAKIYWSKQWGINSASCLQSIHDFSICSGLVQDPMHVFLEGLIPHELKYMLYDYIVVSKYFTLEWLNARITSFSYSYLHLGAKPEILDKTHIVGDGKLKQTSAATMTLICTLPYIISQKVPQGEPKWVNFLRLVQITLISTSPCCSHMTASVLAQLVYEHHTTFTALYPKGKVTPKMHYCIHLPRQMINYGPLRHHWCMRFEAKHGFFKTKKWRCFKNLPLSICLKHQKYMCYKQLGSHGQKTQTFLYSGDTVREGKSVNLHDEYPDAVGSIGAYFGVDHQAENGVHAYKTSSLTIHGHEYRPGCCLVLDYKDDLPQFGILEAAVVINDEKFFIVECMETQYFNFHVLSYVLESKHEYLCVHFSQLFSKWPLSVYKYAGKNCVINKYSHTYELF
ncbi:uncharacterized protein LOC110980918 [Acanthaster planci]|uniref:Uncharacterized protein LOC110980918 n=1 Tax=Acanthaster planci TaxID=133434 RepID=A0A8B7YK98_ACAPL|nr:uncharacterized protein LOC110980918 [Acanthaster planci]